MKQMSHKEVQYHAQSDSVSKKQTKDSNSGAWLQSPRT